MNISIVIHGKQDFLTEEKPDINIELPDLPDKRIYQVSFRVPNSTEKLKYPSILLYFTFKIDYRALNIVWINTDSNLDIMFKNFYLATNFMLYKEDKVTTYLDKADSRWDDKSKIMYVDC